MKQQFLNEGDEGFSAIVASISPLHLQELALTTRRKIGYNDLPETSCAVSTPPRMGSFNIVYEVTFSDGIKWAIRMPATGNVFSPSRLRSFCLDIVTQRFISSRLPCQYPVFITGPLIPTTSSHTPLSLWTSCRARISQSFGTTKIGSQTSSGKEYSSKSHVG